MPSFATTWNRNERKDYPDSRDCCRRKINGTGIALPQ